MKKHLLLKAFLAFASLVLAVGAAKANPTYTTGDLLLSVRATGGTGSGTDYVIDLGQASLFENGASYTLNSGNTGTVNNIGDIGADLTSIYGADWATRTDLNWSIMGTTGQNPSGISNDYVSKMQTTSGGVDTTTPWKNNLAKTSGNYTAAGKINNLATGSGSSFIGVQTTSAGLSSSFAVTEVDATNNNSYHSGIHGGTNGPSNLDLGQYGSPYIEGHGASGITGASLDLFHVTSGANNNNGTLDGTFSIASDGTVTFDSATAVPEPSTYAMVLFGAGIFAFWRMKRGQSANAVIS